MKCTIFNIIYVSCIVLFSSCKLNVNHENRLGDSTEFEVTGIEITSSKKEARRDSLIIQNINVFLRNNNSAIVRNYLFLCDTSNIESFRGYDPKHKNLNIDIHIGQRSVSIRSLPGFYKIKDGPMGRYKITNDSIGRLESYVIEVSLSQNFDIQNYHSTLRFSKDCD